MKQVLYLSYDGMTDPLGQSQVIPYLAGLTQKGYHFHLISFEKKDAYLKEGAYIRELLEKTGITWHPLSYTKKPPVVATIYDLWRMKRLGRKLIRQHQISMVHCRSYISAMAGLSFQRQLNIPFLFDMRGFWADERVDGKLWDLKNPVYKKVYHFFKAKEREFLSEAAGVISLTENARADIDSRKLRSHDQLPVQVIPCCADLNHFNPNNVNKEAQSAFRYQLKIDDGVFTIGYLGAIGTWYMLDEMLSFFSKVLKFKPNAVFIFITHEPATTIMHAAAAFGLTEQNIRVVAAGRKDVPSLLSLLSVSLFFIRPSYSKKASSPTKQGEIMGMGIPIICNRGIGDTDYVVNKYGSGLAIDPSDESEVSKLIAEMDQLAALPKAAIIKGAHDFYSLESGVDKYLSVYRKITGDDKALS